MEKSSKNFQFLSDSFFQSLCPSKDKVKQEQIQIMGKNKMWGLNAEKTIRNLAISASCYTQKAFLTEVCAFQEILEQPPNQVPLYVQDIHSFLQHRTTEEWTLLFYEVYFWYSREGRECRNELFKQNLFRKEIYVFSKQCSKFCNLNRSLPDCLKQKQLERLFHLLMMNQISQRQSKKAFLTLIFPNLKAKLSKFANLYLKYCLQSINEDEWRGNWYIFDVSLFSHDLLLQYEKEMENEVFPYTNEIQVDLIFVVTIFYLIQGELQNWDSIQDIPYRLNFNEIKNFGQAIKNS